MIAGHVPAIRFPGIRIADSFRFEIAARTMSATDEVVEEFEVLIPSDTAAGQAVQERILSILETQNFDDRDVFGIRLAVEEALVNAIKHGNQMDPNKTVRIRCRISSEKARIEIEDQGPGFNPGDVPDPTAEENLERPCGRGIMLMRAFMTSIEFSPSGNRVTLEKHRTPAANSGAA